MEEISADAQDANHQAVCPVRQAQVLQTFVVPVAANRLPLSGR